MQGNVGDYNGFYEPNLTNTNWGYFFLDNFEDNLITLSDFDLWLNGVHFSCFTVIMANMAMRKLPICVSFVTGDKLWA